MPGGEVDSSSSGLSPALGIPNVQSSVSPGKATLFHTVVKEMVGLLFASNAIHSEVVVGRLCSAVGWGKAAKKWHSHCCWLLPSLLTQEQLSVKYRSQT